MAKKTKGKQKEEKAAIGGNGSQPPATEGANIASMGTADKPLPIHQEPEPEPTTWGSTDHAWGSSAEPAAGGDSWGIGDHVDEEWAHADSLLERPLGHSHSILPTIPEQSSSGHFTQNRTFSEAGDSLGEYSDSWKGDRQRGAHSPQSQTLTPTAAASVMGTPIPQPSISLAQAAATAQEQIQRQNKVTHASEAARRYEEDKNLRNNHTAVANSVVISPAARPAPLNPAPAPIKVSTASAYAALHEKNNRNPNTAPAQPPQPSGSGGITWEYPQPFVPNSHRPIPPIPVDPSWIMTGGNVWSNKHRTTKGEAIPRPHIDENAWGQHLNQYRQAEQLQKALHAKQASKGQPHPQRPQHGKHHSYPGHPIHQQQQQRPSAQQKQSWQGWGKEDYDEEDFSEGEETADGWGPSGQHGVADGWGAAGQHGAADAWGAAGQHGAADAWGAAGQHTAPGAWGQSAWGPQPANSKEGKMDRGRAQAKKGEDPWGQWGQAGSAAGGGGGGWDQSALGQQGSAAGWGQDDGWGQQGQQQHQRGQQQHKNHQQQQKPKAGHHAGHEKGRGQEADGWGQEGDGWGPEPSGWAKGAEGVWGTPSADEWGAAGGEWPTTAQQNQTRVSFNVKEVDGSRNAVSAQQRSQILNSFINQTQNPGQKQPAANAAQLHDALAAAAQKGQKQPKGQQDKWGAAWEAEDQGWGSMDGEEGEYDVNRKVHFSPKASDIWGGSPRSVPSKTLIHAQQGVVTTPLNDASNVRFVESQGAAFAFVSNAFFGNSRLARERIHWMFPTNKDQRVANMLAWTQKMSYNLGTFGLMKFLQTRERGALFINTVFRMHQHPQEPAFDWLTFNQLQGTMDKTLQESVAFYDPARLVIVFVYLPSQTGNSVAIWRRKVNVPDNARLKYQAEVNAITKNLRKDQEYIVLVDEIPPKPKAPQKGGQLRKSMPAKSSTKGLIQSPHAKAAAKEKRKWWKFFLS